MRRAAIGTVALVLAGICCLAQLAEELRVATRFGVLSVDENKVLLFEGHPVNPQVQGNSGLDVGEPIRMGGSDVVLVKDIGGTACPYLYRFLTVSKSGVKATSSFGTCNEVSEIKPGQNTIRIFMRGYRGPFEPPAERRKIEKQMHVFIYRDGVVSENGKPAR